MFKLHAPFKPTGDQPRAIEELTKFVNDKNHDQTLLGVTGSGKSLTYDQPVFILDSTKNISRVVKIGEYIEEMFNNNAHKRSGDSYILDLTDKQEDVFTLSWNPKSLKSEYKRVTHLTKHVSPNDIYHITTSCGREVKMTKDHNLWVLSNGRLVLKETCDLISGDYIPLPKKINLRQGLSVLKHINILSYINSNIYCDYEHVKVFLEKLPEKRKKEVLGNNKYSRILCSNERILVKDLKELIPQIDSLPLKIRRKGGTPISSIININRDFLTFLGLYIAEGNSQKNYLLISTHERDLKESLFNILDALSLNYHDRTNNIGDVHVYNSIFSEVISNLCGSTSHKKKFPDWYMQLTNKQLAIMLSAYFSGDGWVHENSVCAITASNQLASDLQYALLRFGIVARKRVTRKKFPNSSRLGVYYEVSIKGIENIEIFNNEIGFLLKRKQKKLLEYVLSNKDKVKNTNVDVIPINGSDIRDARTSKGYTQLELAKKMGVSRSFISLIENNQRNPSRDTYKKLISMLECRSLSSAFLHSYWTPINNIKNLGKQSEFVYDFTVEENETFLAGFGGMFVHNTYTVANLIQEVNKPTLIISHNKTLAAQLYQEFRDFFPENAVEYFVSYYDYYQPESYLPSTDTYIEKDADINEEIDKLRLSATTSLMTRDDVILISSVSCIYNLGSPGEYSKVAIKVATGMKMRKTDLLKRLSQIYYERNEYDFKRGTYRVRGDVVDVNLAYMEQAVRIEFFDDKVVAINFFDPLSGEYIDYSLLPTERRGSSSKSITQNEKAYVEHRAKEGGFVEIFPAKHYVTAEERREEAYAKIESDLEKRLKELKDEGKAVEAYRLEQKTKYDLEMMQEIGYCKGIENYSSYFDGRKPGEAPYTLMDFFPKDYLIVIDESHITIPQIRGMHNGDRARKTNLIDYGFRLPSAYDNRPMNFDEFITKSGQILYVSATPGDYELEKSEDRVAEQLIRPTGIIDPKVTIYPSDNQINHLLDLIHERIKRGQRTLVTTLTKRMAEELSSFLLEKGVKVTYLHSDIDTLERTAILDDLRRGNYDVLVGINLLREGLDLPEVSLVAILDADKEGFLRSESSLIQTMGRAARHMDGEVVMYADNMTKSMKRAITEIERRREIQHEYNVKHNITPRSIEKPVREKLIDEIIEEKIDSSKKIYYTSDLDYGQLPPPKIKKEIKKMEKLMKYEAEMLNFEKAANLRDEIKKIKKFLQ